MQNEQNKTLINIDFNNKNENAADFFDYHHSIVLETTNDCLINEIAKIEFYKDNIYILDSKLDCIFIYDINGQFKYKISRKGESHEEYSSIEDFYIDKEKEHIYIYDGLLGSVLITDLYGNFSQRLSFPKGYSFIKLNNANWLFYLGNGTATLDNKLFNNLFYYDENFRPLKQEFPINKELLGRRYSIGGVKSVFSTYENQIFFLPLLSNIIYVYDSDLNSCIPKYEIRYTVQRHNITLNKDTKALAVNNYIREINRGEIPSRINNFYETKDAVFFNILFAGELFMCFYDKISKTSKIGKFGIYHNGLIFSPPSIYFSDQNNHLIMNIVDGSLLNSSANMNLNEITHDVFHKIKDVEDPNPVLVFYSIKNM